MSLETSQAATSDNEQPQEGMVVVTPENLVVNMAEAHEVIVRNIKTNIDTFENNIKSIEHLNEWRATKAVDIVGGGPSLKDTIHELKDFDRIMACGSAHDFIVDNGFVPNWTVICDPDPIVIKYLTRLTKTTNYLVASQCHPSVIAYLMGNGCNVTLWHAGQNVQEETLFGNNRIVVRGGCTVGMRAVPIAINFGFCYLHLFGFDNCIVENKSHAYSFVDPEKENITKILDIGVGGVMFKMADYHLGQIMDFKQILQMVGHKAVFKSHGPGAITTLLELGRKKALENGPSN